MDLGIHVTDAAIGRAAKIKQNNGQKTLYFSVALWYGLGRPVITSEIGHWSVFVLLGRRFVFGRIMK